MIGNNVFQYLIGILDYLIGILDVIKKVKSPLFLGLEYI